MVAFAKPLRKTHTRCGSAKDSGLRYYSPEISRWLSRDPIGEWRGFGLYGFVRNNPVAYLDILGREPATTTIMAGPSGPPPSGPMATTPISAVPPSVLCSCGLQNAPPAVACYTPPPEDTTIPVYGSRDEAPPAGMYVNPDFDYTGGSLGVRADTICALGELYRWYGFMREANTIGADRWFHCMGSCKATRLCGSARVVDVLVRARELSDLVRNRFDFSDDANTALEQAADSIGDMEANYQGIRCPEENTCKMLLRPVPCERP